MDSPARLAILNARIWTGAPRRPWADAILIHGEQVELVGSSAEIRKRIDASVRTIQANGGFVAPGWRDLAEAGDEPELVEALLGAVRGAGVTRLNVLEPGAPAHLVMLDRDITREKGVQPSAPRVMLLLMAGRVIVDRAGRF